MILLTNWVIVTGFEKEIYIYGFTANDHFRMFAVVSQAYLSSFLPFCGSADQNVTATRNCGTASSPFPIVKDGAEYAMLEEVRKEHIETWTSSHGGCRSVRSLPLGCSLNPLLCLI